LSSRWFSTFANIPDIKAEDDYHLDDAVRAQRNQSGRIRISSWLSSPSFYMSRRRLASSASSSIT